MTRRDFSGATNLEDRWTFSVAIIFRGRCEIFEPSFNRLAIS